MSVPGKRKRRREDYRRWERGRAMELWQMDVMGRVHLAGGLEVKVVTGLDDHSRFAVSAKVVLRATARPVCQALREALRKYGLPDQILTDNGKVFTAWFGTGPGPVMFDRICTDNGIRHLLTAPYSPTTTGKIERLHKTMRVEFFTPNDYKFVTVAELQAALDAWVAEYNTARPHQSCGGRPPPPPRPRPPPPGFAPPTPPPPPGHPRPPPPPPAGRAAHGAPPQQVIDTTGVENDLAAIGNAERRYLAAHGSYASFDQLKQEAMTTFSDGSRRGYQYTVDFDDGQHFTITATPTDPAKKDWPTLSMNETMQISKP